MSTSSIPTALRVSLCAVGLLLAVCAAPCRATQQQLPPDMNECIFASVDGVYKEQFKAAEDEAKKIVKRYPDHPAGYFFCAAALERMMDYYETDRWEREFYEYCDKAIDKAEKILARDPGDDWAAFFLGGANGFMGTYEGRYEKWITSFRHGWKGVSILKALHKKNPYIKDVLFGLGLYDYWRSALTKVLWWMPGIENKCEEGIRELEQARKEGLYTNFAAAANLMAIYNGEGRFKKALALADEVLVRFPGSVKFSWGRAAALFGEERFDESEAVYRYILARVEAEPFDNHYNAVLCHFWLAKIYLKTQRYTQSIAECNRMQYYALDDLTKRRLEKHFVEAGKMREQAKAANVRNPQAEIVP
jgi:tetratricopeptide (TPR) repeat protein